MSRFHVKQGAVSYSLGGMSEKGDRDRVRRQTARVVRPRARAGWAAAFGEVSELGDDDLAWLEFGNDADQDLSWKVVGWVAD